MKIIKTYFFAVLITLPISSFGGGFFPVLSVGYSADKLDPVRDKAIAIAHIDQENGLKPLSAITITNLGSGDNYYALFSNLYVRAFNLANNIYLGEWSLKRTADDGQDKYKAISHGNGMDRDWTEYDMEIGDGNDPGLGCLRNSPMRNGDVNGDGGQELVFFLGNNDVGDGYKDTRLDLVVFSMQLHEVIFSIRLGRESDGGGLVDTDPDYKQKSDYAEMPQRTDATNPNEWAPAMRYFAKLYFGDFDSNGKRDILAWRKRYDSRTIGDTVQGFKLTAQMFTHYELDNGVYKAQPTDEATIKGWLAANNLTWQQGYPNVSECPGEEGKPIPDTVDPMLNDPDVLK